MKAILPYMVNTMIGENPSYKFENPKKESYYALGLALAIFLFYTIIYIARNKGPTPLTTYTFSNVTGYLVL